MRARLPALASLLALGLMAGRALPQEPGMFGSVEIRAASLAALPQWRRVLAAIAAERPAYEACDADPGACPDARLAAWRRHLADIRPLPPRARLQALNAFVNRWPYRLDADAHGAADHWATPLEFLAKSGDCEDFAILKYVSLRDLGVPEADLRIVVLRDTLRDLPHAVLAVRLDGETLILDSLSDAILRPSRLPHYEPHYSVNETHRWAHLRPLALPTGGPPT